MDKNITVVYCQDKSDASKKAFKKLQEIVDKNTLLLLSGGTSPIELYGLISAGANVFHSGGVAMVDERYGSKMHGFLNEKMMIDSGMIELLASKGVPFCAVLEDGVNLEQTAVNYEEKLRMLFAKYPKKVAVMGVGADGHTAGIKPGLRYDHSKWVVAFDDYEGSFGTRVTTTFECLEHVDEFVLLVFGEDKKEALQKMLTDGFYRKSGIPTTVFTDIQI